MATPPCMRPWFWEQTGPSRCCWLQGLTPGALVVGCAAGGMDRVLQLLSAGATAMYASQLASQL